MIDIGVNLASSQFRGEVSQVIQQACRAGLTHIIATGTSLEASRTVGSFAEAIPGVYATAGVHPHKASTWSPAVALEIQTLAGKPNVVAVGECGLDYNRMFSPKDAQLRAFEEQMELARVLDKPVFLHCRDAFEDFRAVLENFKGLRGVVHCFTGATAEALAFIEAGFELGITGWVCDLRRGQDLREAVKHVPSSRLHLETDAPYLLPANLPAHKPRGRNAPAALPWVAKELAALLDRPADVVAYSCAVNSRRLFKLDRPLSAAFARQWTEPSIKGADS